MTALVTGATGFIGGYLTDALLEQGEDVRAIVREPGRGESLRSRGVELVQADVTEPSSLRRAVEGVDSVYHCAALVGDWLNRNEIQRVNVEGTRSLLEACTAAGVGRFVYLSSLAVLGTKHHHGTDESAPYRKSGDAYSDAKIDSEKLVRTVAERGDMETVILRPGVVYGPGDRQFMPRLLKGLANGEFVYVGDGSKLLNIVYIDDLVQAALFAANKPEAGGEMYNLTDGTRTSLREFVTFICEYLGLEPPKRRLSPAVAWTLTYAFESLARVRRATEAPRLNKGRMKFLYYNQLFSIDKARRELGFAPRFTYREGLPPTLEWFREAGQLPERALVSA